MMQSESLEARLLRAYRQKDDVLLDFVVQQLLNGEQLIPQYFHEKIAEWLKANEKQGSEVRWGRFPLGMVQRWIERAEIQAERDEWKRKAKLWERLHDARTKEVDAYKHRVGQLASQCEVFNAVLQWQSVKDALGEANHKTISDRLDSVLVMAEE